MMFPENLLFFLKTISELVYRVIICHISLLINEIIFSRKLRKSLEFCHSKCDQTPIGV